MMQRAVFTTLLAVTLLTLGLTACAKEKPVTPVPSPVIPYTGDNDETYVPMNYYY